MKTAKWVGDVNRRTDSASIAKLEIYDSSHRESILSDPGSISLLEDGVYDIVLSPSPLQKLPVAIFSKPFVRSRVEIGSSVQARLDLSRFVGRVLLEFQDSEDVAPIEIFVRPRKLTYDSEFYRMLEDLSAEAIDLVLMRSERSDIDLIAAAIKSRPTNLQQFFLMRSIFKSAEIAASLARIARFPHTTLKGETRSQHVASGVRNTRSFARAMAMAVERISVPNAHPLSARFKSIPLTVTTALRTETLDTPENRFVKFCLQTFLRFIDVALRQLPPEGGLHGGPFTWLNDAEALLRGSLAKDFCVSAGRISFIPSASAALQRKPGYREIFAAWNKFQSSAALSIPQIEESFAGGKRDAATLYEQWVFLQVRAALVQSFKILRITKDELLQRTKNGFTLRLTSGRKPVLSGVIDIEKKPVAFNLYYNRTFSARGNTLEGTLAIASDTSESWSKSMRPDVTVTLWPYKAELVDGGLRSARKSARLFHVHLDAKYRFNLKSSISKDLPSEDGFRAGSLSESTVVADDIDKMHAYVSAIRHSIAAFVVYPGDDTLIFRESAERVIAVGALSLRPGCDTTETLQQAIKSALLKVAEF